MKGFENIGWLGISQVCSIEMACCKVVFSLFDNILVRILWSEHGHGDWPPIFWVWGGY